MVVVPSMKVQNRLRHGCQAARLHLFIFFWIWVVGGGDAVAVGQFCVLIANKEMKGC